MEGAEERIARLTARLERVERLTEEMSEPRAGRGRVPRRLGGRARAGLVGLLVVLVAAFPLVALAVDIFTDVPTGATFHDQIEAIALAGITTGSANCAGSGTRYCPNDAVDRKSMAAFMHRGFGRVAGIDLPPVTTVPTSEGSITGWNLTLTPGLPANLLSGAAGFIKADAAIVMGQSGSLVCQYRANILIDGTAATVAGFEILINSASSPGATIPLTGARAVTSAGPKTIEVRVWRTLGSCTSVTASGNLTAIYVPFGSAGGNTL